MKILLITQEPPLLDEEVVSGNAVRTAQLSLALRNGGHEVRQVWLSREERRRKDTFRNRDELQALLIRHSPDAVVVSYWELLSLLPFGLRQPVILDFVAPRPLEELFETPDQVRANIRRLRLNLGRCDLVMVGNELQRHLLINTMIEAGFDLRQSDPIIVVPLGSDVIGAPASDPERDGWLLVAGGVTWPWRKTEPYTAVLEAIARKGDPPFRVVHFGGQYRWHDRRNGADTSAGRHRPASFDYRELEPYRHFSEFLTSNAHIGVELAEWNIERHYSQSFRSLEFLRHGLPLLCNRYLPIASLLERHDAGWIVDAPESLEGLLRDILSKPDDWRSKSENALRLVREDLHPDSSAQPLLEWLRSPSDAARLPPEPAGYPAEPVLGVPPLATRLRNQFALVRRVLFARLFGAVGGSGVVFVTRGDLFPPDHGAAVRTVATARALSRRGIAVGIVTDDRKKWFEVVNGECVERPYPLWVRLLSAPGALVKLLHFSKDIPLSNSFLYLPLSDRGFLWRTVAAARRTKAGVLQAEFPAYAQPCIEMQEYLNCSVVLVEHNVEYDRIRDQVGELTDSQYENLKAIEISLCNRAGAVVCVSDNDRQKLAEDGVRADRLHTVPHGVDLAQFELPATADVGQRFGIREGEPVLAFHGTFSYPPNREALRIFTEILLPGLEQLGLNCHVLAIGKDPPTTSPHPRIHFPGSVVDIGPWLKAADMSVIPLVDGGGTRMKIIDCFAASLPVISTSKGIEGIPVVSGEHALVIDDWESLMRAVVDLWKQPELAKALAKGGRSMAESLDWDVIAGRYLGIYAGLG